MIYLDNAATTRKKPWRVYASLFYNSLVNSVNAGRGAHRYSLRGAEVISETQEELAWLFNIDTPERIAFTANATLALNMAIGGVLADGGHAVVTSMEHNSVLRPVNNLGNFTMVYADSEGYVHPSDVEAAVREDTRLIVCTHASNVCGSIQPIAEIGAIAKKHGVLFLVDAAQTAGIVDIDVKKMKADMLAFSGHKGLLSPQGTGGLYVGEGVNLTPIISGGTGSASESLMQPDYMPDMLHAGTLNTPAIAALGEGVRFIRRIGCDRILAHERELATEFIERIDGVARVRVLGGMDIGRRNGTVSFCIDGIGSAEVSQLMDEEYGIAVRGGWHCAYYAHKTLGTEKYGAVRAGFGWDNTMHDVKAIAKAVKEIAAKV